MNTRGWFRYHPGGASAVGEALIAAINRCGVTLEPAGNCPPIGAGVVLFDRVDTQLCEALDQDSRHGFDRVLAVATCSEALTEGAAWRLLEAGAADVFALDAVPNAAATVAARFGRYASVDELLQSPAVSDGLAGVSPSWLSVLRQVVEVAAFSAASVLITGESGTGKELVARLIHALDRRPAKGPFVVLDCTTVSPELAGSEFFGHERGAFTSAVAAREGAFALADRGTLFLDEVGELPLALQAELLRVIQERVYKRVGSNTWKQVNFRLICATNRNLLEEEARGAFRRDFYYRIASWSCALPALAERREDILPLTRHFLRQLCDARHIPEPDAAVRDYLLTRDYPGNARELRQLVTRMLSRHVGDGPLTVGDLPPDERLAAAQHMQSAWHDSAFQCAIRRALAMGLGLKEISSQTADVTIQTALADESGNLHRAARRLGVTDRALQMRRALQLQGRDKGKRATIDPPSQAARPRGFNGRAEPATPTDPSTDR
ncbi:MAG TPA: sigma 54-interacting transcriptional regulator [Chthoniobacterales bacterium]|nr:sigma 54-interacting transcriptional regulator [Chthoniobacterales bacterium]